MTKHISTGVVRALSYAFDIGNDSIVMAKFGPPLRKRLDARKVTETRLKNVAHNVRRIGYLEIMDGIVPY
jgi:hypothetical protein